MTVDPKFLPTPSLFTKLLQFIENVGYGTAKYDPISSRKAVAEGYREFLKETFGEKVEPIKGESSFKLVDVWQSKRSMGSNSIPIATFSVQLHLYNHGDVERVLRKRPDYKEHNNTCLDDYGDKQPYNALSSIGSDAVYKLVKELKVLGMHSVNISDTPYVKDGHAVSTGMMEKILSNKAEISMKLDALRGLADGRYSPEQIMGVTLEKGVETPIPQAQEVGHGKALEKSRQEAPNKGVTID